MHAAPPTAERGQRFLWRRANRTPVGQLRALGELPALLAHLLVIRGFGEPEAARSFLQAEHEPLADPYLMRGLPEAVDRIESALEANELIAIYGDYDVDGLTGTAILCLALARLGGRTAPFIPNRELDGYGLNDGRLEELRRSGASLAITVDCGITAAAEIARARAAGLDVIVTDHHPSLPELPVALVLNPRQPDCGYPFKDLAGVGVAFRLGEALLRRRLPPEQAETAVEELCALAAIGTLGDVVPLRGENRAIVRRGLRRLNDAPGEGLRALIAAAGHEDDAIDADRICFALAPRLNAAGRLDDARPALDLLLCTSADEAGPLAQRLNELNRTRQKLTAEAAATARAELAGRELGPAIIVTGTFPLGIAGLIASRLAEEYRRPAIVLSRDEQELGGSARSVPGLDIVALIATAGDQLERFGGHAMAAGLRLRAERLPEFERRIQAALAEQQPAEPEELSVDVEAELRPSTAASWETLQLLRRLEPYGAANNRPTFLTRGMRIVDLRSNNGGVRRFRAVGDGVSLAAVAFEAAAAPPPGARVDLVYRIRRNARRGTVAPELEVIDWRPVDYTPDDTDV